MVEGSEFLLLFIVNGFDAFHFGLYVSSYAYTCFQEKKTVWEWGRPVFSNQKQGLPYSSCMDIGWSDEINSCPTCFPQFFSEVASTV